MSQQLRSWLAPRYVDTLLNAATLAAAGLSVLAFLAIVWVALYSTTLRHFKFFRELVGRGEPRKRNREQEEIQIEELRRSYSRTPAQRAGSSALRRQSSLSRSQSVSAPIASAHARKPAAADKIEQTRVQ